MTAHDRPTTGDPPTVAEPEPPGGGTDISAAPDGAAPETEPPHLDPVPLDAAAKPVDPDVPRSDTEVSEPSAHTQEPDHELLFATDPSGLRRRWDDIQSAFVDDPTACVQQADGLVAEVVEQLTSQFADMRSRLEAQWARGEAASTEDLRVALKRYREFFQRLLSV